MTGYTSVESLMKNFIKGEIMDRNGYKCSGCKKEARFTKDMSVYRFPKILVLHLKRFYNSYSRREKISSNIKIPEQLDMSPFGPHSSKNFLFNLFRT